MNVTINGKILGSWLLIFVPVILLICQECTGFIPLRADTADPAVFTFIMMTLIAGGYAAQGSTMQLKVVFFLIAFGVLNLIPIADNLLLAAQTLDLEEFTYFDIGLLLPYWFISTPIGLYPLVAFQMLALAVPIAVFVISAIKIASMGKDRSNFSTGVIEIMIMAIILVIACAGFGFLGLNYNLGVI